MALQCGIVGLPNVGKSTLFNCLSNAKAQAANFPFCTIEPNVGRHHGARRADREPRENRQPEENHPHDDRDRRYSRSGQGRVQRRGAGQQVSGQHPRDGRDHPRAALLRERQHHACGRNDRPGARQGDHRHGTPAQGPRNGREPHRQGEQAGRHGRQDGQTAVRHPLALQSGARTGQKRPDRRTRQGGPQSGTRLASC